MYRPAEQEPELTIGSGTEVRYLATTGGLVQIPDDQVEELMNHVFARMFR